MFLPVSPAPSDDLDQAMRDSLAKSLIHIYEVAGQRMSAPDIGLDESLSEIRAHRVSPGVFGRYYDLVFAVHEERYEHGRVLLQDIIQLASERPIMAALPFSEEALGPDAERYARLLGLETNSQAAFAAPELDAWITFRANLAAALACIEEADAALGAELRSLVLQIVGAVPDAKTPGSGFGGASSFMLWGAILLNVERLGTVLDMIAGLVHEAAHQLLFGLSVGELLGIAGACMESPVGVNASAAHARPPQMAFDPEYAGSGCWIDTNFLPPEAFEITAMIWNKPRGATVYGIDLGKNIFLVVGADPAGNIIQRVKFRRDTLLAFFERAEPALVGMEACPGSQWLARKLQAIGHSARIISAQFVKPYVKSNKNDIIDAAAIAEAVVRPTMLCAD